MKKLIIVGFVLLVIAYTISAQAGNPFIIEESGSFVSKVIEGKADLVITSGKGQGTAQTSTQSVIEWGPFLEGLCDGNYGYESDLVIGRSVIRTVQGLIFASFDIGQGTNCFNLTTFIGTISLEGGVTGGTGFYESATGTIKVTGTVYPVLFAPGPEVKFGGVELKAELSLNK